MSLSVVRRRERIARVRRVEHAQAAAHAAAAEKHLESLETSEERLTMIRASLSWELGDFNAATLASRAELGLRLDEARFGLSDAIAGARAAVEARRADRIEARKRQESAEKLGERAAAEVARAADRKASSLRGAIRRSLSDVEELH